MFFFVKSELLQHRSAGVVNDFLDYFFTFRARFGRFKGFIVFVLAKAEMVTLDRFGYLFDHINK